MQMIIKPEREKMVGGGESTCFGDGEEQTTTLAQVLFLMLTRVLMSAPFFQNLPEYHLLSAIGSIRVH